VPNYLDVDLFESALGMLYAGVRRLKLAGVNVRITADYKYWSREGSGLIKDRLRAWMENMDDEVKVSHGLLR
jgi:hypothetical protein